MSGTKINKWLTVVSTSMPKQRLASRIPPHLCFLSALFTLPSTPNFPSSCTCLPPASNSYKTLLFQPCVLSCPSCLVFFCTFSSSHSHSLFSLLVIYLLSQLWTFPDASGCSLPHIYKKTFSSTVSWSSHFLTLYSS